MNDHYFRDMADVVEQDHKDLDQLIKSNVKEIKGLLCDIYKPYYGDAANGGLSCYCWHVILAGKGIPEVFSPNEATPLVRLERRELHHMDTPYLTIYPWEMGCANDWMFGGCFVYSSDSRFRVISPYPIPLHDRRE
jgi:hypothetical protein